MNTCRHGVTSCSWSLVLSGPRDTAGTCHDLSESWSSGLGVAGLKSQGLDVRVMRWWYCHVNIYCVRFLEMLILWAVYMTPKVAEGTSCFRRKNRCSHPLTYQPSGTRWPGAGLPQGSQNHSRIGSPKLFVFFNSRPDVSERPLQFPCYWQGKGSSAGLPDPRMHCRLGVTPRDPSPNWTRTSRPSTAAHHF